MPFTRPILSAALLALASASAQAADADALLEAPEVVLDASRSGVYLRGDLGYAFGSDLDGTQLLALPGVVASSPAAGLRLDEAGSVGAGIGYRFNDMLRADATLRYGRSSLAAAPVALPGCGVPCAGYADGDARTLELLGTAYVDLGTFAGVTPYLGAGLGALRLDYGDAGLTGCGVAGCAALAVEGESGWRFAYALTAGVSYDLRPALTLDLGYRFLDAESGEAWRATSPAGALVALADDGVQRHALSLGLRFELP